tara:strand:+ start:1869 stop:2660 length:792 start_codon:yes stop_codon:yes gene_type:complete
MPIPKPTDSEDRSSFMSRCMSDRTMLNEYAEDQRTAVCSASFNAEKEDKSSNEFLDCEFKQIDADDEGVFEGYASVFGNKDLGNDVIEKGAFAKSIYNKKPKQIKLLYQHKTDEPIGVIESIEEDNKGLKVKGRLALGTQKGREVFELMKMGAIDSMSIGYRLNAKGYHYDDKGKKRVIKEVDLMEISMVTFPMNTRAKVTKVKFDKEMLETITERELESHLRDVGWSFSTAKQSASILHKSFNKEQRDVVDSINRVINLIKT